MLKAFAMSTETGDGFSVLLGGLCHSSWCKKIERQLLGLQQLTFGNYCDPYEIDLRFVRLLFQLQRSPLPYVLAGCIAVPYACGHCGAVLGIPNGSYASADAEENPSLLLSNPTVYSACYPGKMGMAFASSHEDARDITAMLDKAMTGLLTREVLEETVEFVRHRTNVYVLCSDIQPLAGGGFSGGSLRVSDGNIEEKLFI